MPRASANAQIPKELKQKLFARYDGQNLNVMQPKILVTGLDGSGGTITDYSINYDHFYPAFIKSSWPKNYQKRNQKEREQERRYAYGPFIKDLLPVFDALYAYCRAVD